LSGAWPGGLIASQSSRRPCVSRTLPNIGRIATSLAGIPGQDPIIGWPLSRRTYVLNDFVAKNDVRSVIEFGCGDGNQLRLCRYPRYIGIDISRAAVEMCRRLYGHDKTKKFYATTDVRPRTDCELALSLDVIYHLVEDEVYDRYMTTLFDAASRFVICYSSNEDLAAPVAHIRHRRFTRWVEQSRPDWTLVNRIDNIHPFDEFDANNTSFADFYIFRRN